MKHYRFDVGDVIVITFDDEKTSLNIIKKRIQESGSRIKDDSLLQ